MLRKTLAPLIAANAAYDGWSNDAVRFAAREAGIALDTVGNSSRSLRLASKQRTKQHEFSSELKAAVALVHDRPRYDALLKPPSGYVVPQKTTPLTAGGN